MNKDQLVLLLGKRNFLVSSNDKKLHTEFGVVDLTKLSKKKFGDEIKTHTGEKFTVVKPTIIDILMKRGRRLPQIVTPADASFILGTCGIAPNSLIVDAGSGSGFLSIFLAYYCQHGRVVTYEKNKKFAKIVKENVKLVGLRNIKIKQKDIFKGIEEKGVDLIVLDMKDAEGIVKKVGKILKTGGWIVVYSPYIEQVKKVVEEFQKHKIVHVKTVENIRRSWQVEDYTRPHTSGVMHTGWLSFGRKIG